jgi:DNA-binding NtrC family response regulator
MEAMQNYHWPGNVRELQNYVERAVVMADRDELTLDLLPPTVVSGEPTRSVLRGGDIESLTYEVVQRGLSSSEPDEDDLHTKIVNRVERELIAQVMIACNNVQTKAAAKLGINRNTLHKKLKEYELDGQN